jgi:hypothetical protein
VFDGKTATIVYGRIQAAGGGRLFDKALEAEMKSEFFSMFGIPPTECEIEARKDELGVPRLWFRSTGNPLVGLDLTGATQLQHLLTDAGDANQANEIGQHIAKAQHLR